ncbi:hypothetical protein ACFQ8C_35445 [Streptomyces sp. NPDC056503]|uniref:hypothetical protein n=1 Tax=Streptomyces sp. NPDC056503 TaxID=3345842 RepID=UPI0036A64912
MPEVPATDIEVRRLGRTLLAQVRTIAAHVTPAAVIPESALPEAPEVAEWTDPLRYRFALRVRIGLDADLSAGETVHRAVEAFTTGGFDIVEERRAGTVAARVVVTGSRAGFRIDVRVWPATGDVVYAGVTPTVALRAPRAPERPDPVRTAETVESGHVLCYECDGLGWCPACGGLSWVLDDAGLRRRCPECWERRVCPICRGAGQLQIARLRRAERAFYPELADPLAREDES